jgi:Ca2+-binding EF-hand superfamily protein
MASKKGGRKAKGSSDAGQSFDPKMIEEFKQIFGIMDQNKDGIIDKADLKDLYAQMGQVASDSQVEEMLKEADGPLSFAAFLNLFGDRMGGTDPEETVFGAFQMFDRAKTGYISEQDLMKILQNKRYGEPFTEKEVEAMHKGKPPIEKGQVDYKVFAHIICTGAQDELANA